MPTKLGLKPEPPPPTRETYSKFADPVDELFTRLSRMDTPLKLLEGLIIPKTMKGAREAWVFVFVLLLMGTLTGVDMGLALAGVPVKKGGVNAAMDYLAECAKAPARKVA